MVGRYTVFSKTSMNRIFVVFGLNSLLLAETLATLTSTYFSCGGSITLTPFTLKSFKARDVTLKYAWLLNIGILALDQERTVFVVSKFEYAQCKERRPIKFRDLIRVAYHFRFL